MSEQPQDAKSNERACKCGAMLVSNVTGVAFPCPFCGDKGGKDASVRDLSRNEMDDLRRARMDRRIADHDWTWANEPPFTPEEARWHAREFIAHNERGNLVRMLAEAFIALQDGHSG